MYIGGILVFPAMAAPNIEPMGTAVAYGNSRMPASSAEEP